MLVGDNLPPLDLCKVTERAFLEVPPEDSEREAKVYLGMAEPVN